MLEITEQLIPIGTTFDFEVNGQSVSASYIAEHLAWLQFARLGISDCRRMGLQPNQFPYNASLTLALKSLEALGLI